MDPALKNMEKVSTNKQEDFNDANDRYNSYKLYLI